MMEGADIVISGYCSLDRIIRIDSDAKIGRTSIVTNKDNGTIHYGGCSINVAHNLAKLGKRALPIIRVGDDYASSGFETFMDESGMVTDAVRHVKNACTSATYLIENPDSEHITLFYPGAMDKKHVIAYEDAWFEHASCAVMTVGSFADNKAFLGKAKQHGLPLFLGMKMDKDAFPTPFLKDVVRSLTGLFANESETVCLLEMFGLDKPEDLFGVAPKMEMLIVTKGLDGSTAYQRADGGVKTFHEGIVKTDNVIDAVGSGDAYISGFMEGYLNGEPIRTCMRYGATLASFALEGMGATTATPDHERFIQRYNARFKKGKS